MFGMALAMRPWVIDDLGRDRDIAAAGPAERRWYGVGIAGQGIVISVLLAAQLGIIHASSLPPIEWLTIGVALVMCGWLGTLIQDSRLRSAAGKPPDA
jgi:hypothetical protein